jgi:hypothetical protein
MTINTQPTAVRLWIGALRTLLIVSGTGTIFAGCAHIPEHYAHPPSAIKVPVPVVNSALPITLKNVDLSALLNGLPIPDHIQQPGDPHWDFYAWATGRQ